MIYSDWNQYHHRWLDWLSMYYTIFDYPNSSDYLESMTSTYLIFNYKEVTFLPILGQTKLNYNHVDIYNEP
jgi:hypothetical protein